MAQLFHTRTRQGRHANPIGETYRFLGKVEPLPALKPQITEDAIIYQFSCFLLLISGWFGMKTRNAFATLTIYILSALTIPVLVNLHKAQAESISDCRQFVTGTYLTTLFIANFGSFRGITTFTGDGNFVATASIQSGDPNIPIPPFSNTQGSWKCISDTEITATGLNFNYPTATLPASITRSDFRATFDPKDGTFQETTTLRTFDINANPLNDDAPVVQTITGTGQRVKPGQ